MPFSDLLVVYIGIAFIFSPLVILIVICIKAVLMGDTKVPLYILIVMVVPGTIGLIFGLIGKSDVGVNVASIVLMIICTIIAIKEIKTHGLKGKSTNETLYVKKTTGHKDIYGRRETGYTIRK